jgi:hypothetical protein
MNGTYKPVLTTVVAESDRSVLKPGNTIQTSVTACMSDDSFLDIAKCVTIAVTTAVATVDANKLRHGVGVALIFAQLV